MQNKVKIINFKATDLGAYKALELDFEKFKSGVIAIKGQVGAGKSTIQKGIQTTTQGRGTLADQSQYGEVWESEIQLSDGERKIFIGAKKKEGKTLEYVLFEKDENEKKIISPVIDGIKATPAEYLKVLTTELTFGIKDFLDKNATIHRKFMFSLFKPELKKLGVVEIEKELDLLTAERDKLRTECTHNAAFMADFEREGYKSETLGFLESVDIEALSKQKEALLVERGTLAEKAKTDLEKKKADLEKKGAEVNGKIRDLSDRLREEYNNTISELEKKRSAAKDAVLAACEMLKVEYSDSQTVYEVNKKKHSDSCEYWHLLNDQFEKMTDRKLLSGNSGELFMKLLEGIKTELEVLSRIAEKSKPKKIVLPVFENGLIRPSYDVKLKPVVAAYNSIPANPDEPVLPTFEGAKLKTKEYEHENFTPLFADRAKIGAEYMSVTESTFSTSDYDNKIELLSAQIKGAENNNKLISRFELNQIWCEAANEVQRKRDELAVLYAGIDTGVEGLKMTVFYNNEKPEIKTTYDGTYDPTFFANPSRQDRLLVGYSQTQSALIGVLLQVARLKRKAKVFPYIFLDDVPMSGNATAVLARIAEENTINVITSFTGDFDRDKLKDNELLVEGGEVFFKS